MTHRAWLASFVACISFAALVQCTGGDPDLAPKDGDAGNDANASDGEASSADGHRDRRRRSLLGVARRNDPHVHGRRVRNDEEGHRGARYARRRRLSPRERLTDSMVVDDAHVYWPAFYKACIFRCPRAGCAPTGPERWLDTGTGMDAPSRISSRWMTRTSTGPIWTTRSGGQVKTVPK